MNLQVWTQWSVLLTAPHTFFTWNPEAHIFSGSLTPAQSLLFPLFSSLDITASLDVVFFSTCTHSLGALSQRMTWSPFICWWPSNLHSIFNATLGLQTRMYIYLLETSAWMPTISKTSTTELLTAHLSPHPPPTCPQQDKSAIWLLLIILALKLRKAM